MPLDPRWFNLSPSLTRVFGVLCKPYNAFNRHFDPARATPAHQWGFGLLQAGHRHLLYIGHDRAYVLFVCVWGRP